MAYEHDNPFARILRGDAPCIKVCETDNVLAFMDLMPQSDGHVLVVPKELVTTIFELSDNAAESCMRVTRHLAVAVRDALQPDGVVIAQLNGRAAGQTIAHVHFHIIPRWSGRPLKPHARVAAPKDKLDSLAERIRAHLDPTLTA